MADIIATERIYDPEQFEKDLRVVMFHEGDVIPEATAVKLGLVKPAATTKKVTAAEVEDKSVKPATKAAE